MKNTRLTAILKNGKEKILLADHPFPELFDYCREYKGFIKGYQINEIGDLEKDTFHEDSFYYIGKVNFSKMEMYFIATANKNCNHVIVIAADGEVLKYTEVVDINETKHGDAFSEDELKNSVFFEGNDHYLRLNEGVDIMIIPK